MYLFPTSNKSQLRRSGLASEGSAQEQVLPYQLLNTCVLQFFLVPFVWRSCKHGVKIASENILRDRLGRISALPLLLLKSERCIP